MTQGYSQSAIQHSSARPSQIRTPRGGRIDIENEVTRYLLLMDLFFLF